MADISHISIPSFNIDGDINDTIARTTINNHVADKNNPHNVTKAQIGLGNVDNTSDMDKPISTAVQNALDKKANNTLATESSPGLMSAEDKKAVDREFFKLVPRGATYVPHGADLRDNQYFKVGTYYHDQKPSEKPEERGIIYGMPGAGLHESPLAGEPFTMYVMAPYSDKYDDESTADEMTLERLRIMIVEGSIYTQGAFNRYKVVEPGEGELNEKDWFTDYWTKIADEADINFLKDYIDKHVYSKSNPHGVTKDQVGLGNVDNTADKDKSVNHANSAGYADDANFANHSGYADTANHVSWGNVSGKPSTYPPSSHTHTKDQVGLDNVDNTADKDKSVKYAESAGSANSVAWDNVTGKPSTIDSSVAWDDITDKPSTYPPSSHTHTPDEVGLGNVDNTADKDKSVKYATTAGTANSITWKNVSDKPSTYPPDAHTHTPSEVGLGNVDNTADKDKPISTAVQKALDGKANTSVATSSTDGLMSKSDKVKLDSIEAGSNVESVNGKTGAVTLNKADIGLGNVDNTADLDKSVKYAESAGSVDSVAWENVTDKPSTYPPSSHTHIPADIGLGNVDNTADKDKSVKYATTAGTANSVAWDDITNKPSTIASSVAWDDITDKPSTYLPSSHTHTPSEVGLGNVDNTSDVNKPISTAVQNALNNKVTKSNTADTNGLLNSLTTSSDAPKDADYYISQYAGGGTTTTTYHRRPMSALWAYIKSKIDDIILGHTAIKATRAVSQSTSTSGYWSAMVNSNYDGSPTTPTAGRWWHILSMDWAGAGRDLKNWVSQLAIATQDGNGVWWRRNDSPGRDDISSSEWHRLAEGDSYGAAISANIATKATQDSSGQQINSTYIKNLSVSGRTITYTRGNGTTGTITTQDTNTTYNLASSSSNGLMSAADKSKLDGIGAGSNVKSVNGKTGVVNLIKADIGLSNVDNTADKDKSVKHADTAGSATNDRTGNDIVDTYATNETVNAHISNTNNPHKVTKAQVGLGNVDNTADKDKSVKYAESAGSANSVAWDDISGKPSTFASSVTWKNVTDKPSTYPPSSHTHTPSEVGLGNVDNTADKDKPISTAVQKALDNKVTKNNTADTNGLLNSLASEETTPTDADYYISQHAGGGTTTTTYHRRPMSALWAYIKSKIDDIILGYTAIKVTRGASQSTSTGGYWSAMVNSNFTGSPTTPTAGRWWHILSMDWANSGNSYDLKNWISQLAIATQDGNGVWWRRNDSPGRDDISSSEWHRLAEGDSYGAAISANTATKATQDSSGQQIDSTYIKNLSVSGQTITYTRGDGSTGSITTQDTNTTYDILNSVFPVGSIYMSTKSTSPASFIGGTWLPITNKFLFASGSVYAAGETGGEYNHTLNINEMPKHTHDLPGVVENSLKGNVIYVGSGTERVSYAPDGGVFYTADTGGNKPHNNMPPYLVVYMWRRTA